MITSHKELAVAIKGKKILHLNSLGKDAVITLEWLNNFAQPAEIVSCYYKLEAGYVDDAKYWSYLKKRYPKTKFVTELSPMEMNEKMLGMLQSPVFINHITNNQEFTEFNSEKIRYETLKKYGCDFICSGISCYEGMGRALYIRKVGLMDEKRKMIFPIGLMKQKQVTDLIKATGIKLNPSYKFAPESFDSASYFKMRTALIAKPEYRKIMMKHYPMLALDEYRFEVLFNGKK